MLYFYWLVDYLPDAGQTSLYSVGEEPVTRFVFFFLDTHICLEKEIKSARDQRPLWYVIKPLHNPLGYAFSCFCILN